MALSFIISLPTIAAATMVEAAAKGVQAATAMGCEREPSQAPNGVPAPPFFVA